MFYTTLTNFSINYLVMRNVSTVVGGIKWLYHVCPHVSKILYSLKLVDYVHVQVDNPRYNYYIRVCFFKKNNGHKSCHYVAWSNSNSFSTAV